MRELMIFMLGMNAAGFVLSWIPGDWIAAALFAVGFCAALLPLCI